MLFYYYRLISRHRSEGASDRYVLEITLRRNKLQARDFRTCHHVSSTQIADIYSMQTFLC